MRAAWSDVLPAVDPDAVVRRVAAERYVSYLDIRGRRRYPRLVQARVIAARRLRDAGFSFPEIGRALGGRHHTSVMWYLGLIEDRKGPVKAP